MKRNQILVIAVLAFILLVGILVFFLRNKSESTKETENILPPTQEMLPTINPSTKVSLTSDAKKQNVTFTIDNIPDDITTIEYELVYEHDMTKRDIAEGAEGTRKEDAAIGTLQVEGKSLTKKLYLGTCSATCTPHLGVNSVNLSIKFLGGSVPFIYENEFSI